MSSLGDSNESLDRIWNLGGAVRQVVFPWHNEPLVVRRSRPCRLLRPFLGAGSLAPVLLAALPFWAMHLDSREVSSCESLLSSLFAASDAPQVPTRPGVLELMDEARALVSC